MSILCKTHILSTLLSFCIANTLPAQKLYFTGIWEVHSIQHDNRELVNKEDGVFFDFRDNNVLYGGDAYSFTKGTWQYSADTVLLSIDKDMISGHPVFTKDSILKVKGFYPNGKQALIFMKKLNTTTELGILATQVHYLRSYPNKTIQKAVNKHFTNPEWKSKYNSKLEGFAISVSGDVMYEGEPAKATLNFYTASIFDVELLSLKIRDKKQSSSRTKAFLKKIFE